MAENNAMDFLRRALVISPHDRLERVENLLVPGMPDANGCISGREFWIENKQPVEPKRDSTPLFGSNHKFSQDQLNWFLKQINAGGRAYAFVWTDKRGMLFSGKSVDLLNTLTVPQLEMLALWKARKPVTVHERNFLRDIISL